MQNMELLKQITTQQWLEQLQKKIKYNHNKEERKKCAKHKFHYRGKNKDADKDNYDK